MKKELTLHDYIQLVFRRKWMITGITTAVLMATGLFLIFSPSVYESASTFMLETQNVNFSEKGMMLQEQTRPLGYYQAIMRSRVYRNRVQDLFFEASEDYTIPKDFNAQRFYKLVKSGLLLTASDYSDFIQLVGKAHNPNIAFRLATAATDVLKDRSQEIDREELQNAVNFIEQQTAISKAKLEDAENGLQDFREKYEITALTEDGSLVNELYEMQTKLTEIQSQLNISASQIAGIRQRLKSTSNMDSGESDGLSDTRSEAFRSELAELEDQKQRLIQLQGESHPEVLKLQDQIDRKKRAWVAALMQSAGGGSDANLPEVQSMQERLVEEEIHMFTLKNQERYYEQLILDYKRKHPNIMDQSIELMRLSRAQKVAENLYNFLLEKGEEAKIQAATGTGGIRIVDNPVFPKQPVPVSIPRNLMLALFLGLGLGFGVALVQEYMDHAIYSKSEITQPFGITVLGEIPAYGGLTPRKLPTYLLKGSKPERDEHLNEGPLISQMAMKSSTAEAFRSLRSNMQFINVDQNLSAIVLSSANAEEGKSLTSANLAIAYAMLGKKVVLVDADLRKPRLHKLFDVPKSPGITEHLVENAPLSKLGKKTPVDNLFLIPAGKTPPNPSELIASNKMKDLVQKLRKTADLIIFDSAPLLPVTDTFVLAGILDGIMLVVKHGSTSKYELERAVEMLNNAKIRIVGAVLNQIPLSRGYGYYYYYGKSYKGYY